MYETKQPTEIIELDMKKIAWQNLIMNFVLVIVLLVLNGVIHQTFEFHITFLNCLLFCILYILLIVLHEAFHLIGFMLYGKVPYRSLAYGVNLKLGVAYATTEQPIQNKAMKKALLLPFWTTGILPAIIGLTINSPLLVMEGAFLIAGAVGDFSMYFALKKYPNDYWVKDDPELPKLYLFDSQPS